MCGRIFLRRARSGVHKLARQQFHDQRDEVGLLRGRYRSRRCPVSRLCPALNVRQGNSGHPKVTVPTIGARSSLFGPTGQSVADLGPEQFLRLYADGLERLSSQSSYCLRPSH